MQTFLVSYNLSENFKQIDGKRCFKNLLEGRQILQACLDKNYGWQNHPAVRQFRGYESLLMNYIEANYHECLNRNIAVNTNLWFQTIQIAQKFNIKHENNPAKPNWWGRQDILKSHKSRLYCKGEIDAFCAAIKKEFKIKSIDKWLKEKFKKTKNELRWNDINLLDNFILESEQKIKIPDNYYAQFGWQNEVDFRPDMDYIWPVQN